MALTENLHTILEMPQPWLHFIFCLSISNYASLMVKNVVEFRRKFMNKNFIKCFIVMLFWLPYHIIQTRCHCMVSPPPMFWHVNLLCKSLGSWDDIIFGSNLVQMFQGGWGQGFALAELGLRLREGGQINVSYYLLEHWCNVLYVINSYTLM